MFHFTFHLSRSKRKLSASCVCNEQPSPATANPVGGKACSSTKSGLLCYIPNTYSIHKVSSLKFAYFQGRLSRYITSPSEKTRPESWPGTYMGKATPVWQLSSSHRCHQICSSLLSFQQRQKDLCYKMQYLIAISNFPLGCFAY